jgi:hypothetical protein
MRLLLTGFVIDQAARSASRFTCKVFSVISFGLFSSKVA